MWDVMMHCWASGSWYLQGNIAFILKHKAQANSCPPPPPQKGGGLFW
jgi:hypothetical protein